MAEGIVIGNLTIPVIKGDKGDKGNAGEIASISLVLLSPSSTAYAINNGSTTQAQIELGIPKGLSVSTTNINASGELVFTFNDNSTVNVGKVVGKGISEVTVTDDFDFVVTYTDGTSVTACNLEDEVLGTINDILESYYTKTEIDNKGFITKEVNNLTNYTLKTSTGSSIELSINSSTYVMTLNLKNSAGTVISTGTVDLPLETMVVGATYDNTNKKIVLTLKNGSTIDVPVGDLVSGLQSEITSNNKLSSDLVDDTSHTNKFVTSSNKSTWNAKYDKPSGGIPKTDLASDVQTSLGKADTAIQSHQDITGKEDTSNKVTSIDENSTNTQYPGAKLVYDELVERDERITALENTSGHVYGIRRKITSNSSSAWERLFDSIGKVANATKNGDTVVNDFDSLAPWSEIKTCNYDLTTKKIKAWFGDANFKFDGTNGDVFTYVPNTYWKIYQENDYDYVLLADYPKTGFKEIDGFFIGRYNGSVVDDVLHSYSGLVPTTNETITQFRTLTNTLGTNFSQLDWRYFVLQMLYLVEYADYNSQNKLGNGIMNRKYLQTLVAESNTNRAIVSSSSGYYIGQTIRIGTSNGGTQVADSRKITAIENYSENGISGVALTFDGAAVNIAVDNYVCTMAQEAGQCDSLGMKSGCLNNDGYHAVIYRGVENIFANIWQFVDGINIKDNVAYICKEHSEYVSDKFETPYKALGYTNINVNEWAKTLGFDVNEPFFRFPTEVGGGSSNYMSDYYYQNSGNRVALVGGSFYNGAYAGLWCWYFDAASSIATWNIGCRVLINNQ